MNTPNINQIKAMTKEERNALNRRTQRKIALNIVGLVFVKLAMPKVLGSIATKAIITAAKRV